MTRRIRVSLLWKILLSTSLAITLLFGFTGWLVQRHAVATASMMLADEVKASFEAYKSLWEARAEKLAAASRILSAMSDVRAAFGTRDEATIRDTAGELWGRVSDEEAIFVVTDPVGRVIASLGGAETALSRRELQVVRSAAHEFPGQASGFMIESGDLYQIVVTPVYVQSAVGQSLLNVLVAGYRVDALVAGKLKEATGGSEFVFLHETSVLASTLDGAKAQALANAASGLTNGLLSDGAVEYAPLQSRLVDVEGKPIADLYIFRSFESALRRIEMLRRDIFLICLLALLAGLLSTYLLARAIVGPVKKLDRAAEEVVRQNYDYRVLVDREDELGRLAKTFNTMCASIQSARQELIRQE
ncbi:MAG: HAMP domain-containing protein, partial [Bryobacteraceae bacterium]